MGGAPGAVKTRPDARPPTTLSGGGSKDPFPSQFNVLATDCPISSDRMDGEKSILSLHLSQ